MCVFNKGLGIKKCSDHNAAVHEEPECVHNNEGFCFVHDAIHEERDGKE